MTISEMFKSCQKESILIIKKDLCCEMRKSGKTFTNSSEQLKVLEKYVFSKLNVVQQSDKECLEELHKGLRYFFESFHSKV